MVSLAFKLHLVLYGYLLQFSSERESFLVFGHAIHRCEWIYLFSSIHTYALSEHCTPYQYFMHQKGQLTKLISSISCAYPRQKDLSSSVLSTISSVFSLSRKAEGSCVIGNQTARCQFSSALTPRLSLYDSSCSQRP